MLLYSKILCFLVNSSKKKLVYNIIFTNIAKHAGKAVKNKVTQKKIKLNHYFALKNAQAIFFLALKSKSKS